ncbi:hypothetical protein ACSSZE_15100 [Acidithiobacillus caldus]
MVNGVNKPPMNIDTPAPIVIREAIHNRVEERKSISELCQEAGVRLRVEDPEAYRPRILVDNELPTAWAWGEDERTLLVINRRDIPPDFPSLRILEILAYGFHDYVARECLCHQGYFDGTRAYSWDEEKQ